MNREWASTGDYVAPSLERSPEVYYILQALDAYGCQGFLDIHGDEEIEGTCWVLFVLCYVVVLLSCCLCLCPLLNCPHPPTLISSHTHTLPANFLNKGTNGAATVNASLEALHRAFTQTLLDVNPDFQTDKDYGTKAPGTQNFSICSAQITQRFQCFAATLEQPFKDTADEYPQETTGWNPVRCERLGWTLLDAFHSVAVGLKSDGGGEGKL